MWDFDWNYSYATNTGDVTNQTVDFPLGALKTWQDVWIFAPGAVFNTFPKTVEIYKSNNGSDWGDALEILGGGTQKVTTIPTVAGQWFRVQLATSHTSSRHE